MCSNLQIEDQLCALKFYVTSNRFCELEFLTVALPFTFRIDLLYFFSHLTPPLVLSTIKSAREMRVGS